MTEGRSQNYFQHRLRDVVHKQCADEGKNHTLGIPNFISSSLFNPCLKKVILPIFPDMWNIATNISAALKSKKNRAIGRKIVDEPKPAMVPTTSEKNARVKKTFIN